MQKRVNPWKSNANLPLVEVNLSVHRRSFGDTKALPSDGEHAEAELPFVANAFPAVLAALALALAAERRLLDVRSSITKEKMLRTSQLRDPGHLSFKEEASLTTFSMSTNFEFISFDLKLLSPAYVMKPSNTNSPVQRVGETGTVVALRVYI